MSGKFTIKKGEDRIIKLDMIRKTNTNVKRPFDLTGWTKITVQFRKSNNDILEIDSDSAHGRASTATYEGVIYTADNVGIIGDNISLVFDGVDDIATVIAAWNIANPANTVSSDAADDTVVPSAATVNLSGGLNNYSKVTVPSPETEGVINVQLDNEDTNSLKIGQGQSVLVIIDFGDHDLGNRRIASAKNAINVESIGL